MDSSDVSSSFSVSQPLSQESQGSAHDSTPSSRPGPKTPTRDTRTPSGSRVQEIIKKIEAGQMKWTGRDQLSDYIAIKDRSHC